VPLPSYSLYSTSLEYVPFSVSATGTLNPTGVNPQFAFLQVAPPTQPAGTQYVTGTWQGAVSPYVGLCLVGVGGVATLTAGLWYSWLKITSSPEVVVRYAGVVQVS
jgi:hypothetical protein